MRRLLNRLALLAATASVAVAGPAAVAHAEFGVTPEHFKTDLAGAEAGLAGAPADYHVGFNLNRREPGNEKAAGDGTAKDVEVELPSGLIGNPTSIPTCSINQVMTNPRCPAERAVGVARTKIYLPTTGTIQDLYSRIFRVPTEGNEAAAFAFSVFLNFPVRISVSVDPENGYRIRSRALDINEGLPPLSSDITFWGIPQEHSGPGPFNELTTGTFGGPQPATMARTRFFSTPTNCERTSLVTTITLTSWQTQQPIAPLTSSIPGVTGCNELSFDPAISVTPENQKAGAPSGYKVDVTVPQNEDPYGRLTPSLKNAVVHLPAGLAISPPQAQGLDACTDAQVGLHSAAAAACPEASKIGTLQIVTPLLEEPLSGSVYIGSQLSSDPESGQMYRLFLVAKGPGTLIKLNGAIAVNAQSGQVTATFDENPELPFSDFILNLKGGSRASLVNPSTCGTYSTATSLSSWAGQVATPQSSFTIDQNCDGLSRFTPGFEAGTADPAAGHYSSFNLRVTRPEGQQNVSRIDATLPDGLLAKLAGVPLCGDAQAGSGDCPAASQVGKATVAVGEGAAPLYVPQAGKAPTGVYLAGPYKGAPYSLVIKVPAQAGPFDLGTVAVRTALQIDPVTTQVTAKSDALPQILGGVPLAYRDIRVNIDRPGFILNPTSCEPMNVGGTITSSAGKSASVSNPFQTVNCERLGLRPSLAIKFSGAPTRRGGHPKLTATLTTGKEEANLHRVQVTLPKTEFLENAHIKTVCTRVQYAANQCPAKSIYGYARAWTPLLDKPLEGPVYLRSSDHTLPDLVASLDGQIHVDLDGRIDSVHRRIRNTFETVPDAPVSKFQLTMQGGGKGLLVNNTQLCKAKPRAKVVFGGQNGKKDETNPLVDVGGCGKHAKARKGHKSKGK